MTLCTSAPVFLSIYIYWEYILYFLYIYYLFYPYRFISAGAHVLVFPVISLLILQRLKFGLGCLTDGYLFFVFGIFIVHFSPKFPNPMRHAGTFALNAVSCISSCLGEKDRDPRMKTVDPQMSFSLSVGRPGRQTGNSRKYTVLPPLCLWRLKISSYWRVASAVSPPPPIYLL